MNAAFLLPIWFDLGATLLFAVTGALAAMRRGYDVVGVVALALISGVGGGILRDAVFIQQGPPVVATDARYLYVVVIGAAIGAVLGDRVQHFNRVIAVFDALGLGAYAVVGVQKSLGAGLSLPAAVLVGVVNAAGGGLLRDVITNQEPLAFRPGQFYALVALAGAIQYVFMTVHLELAPTSSAFVTIGTTFILRMLTITLNWKTTPFTPSPPA
ncbi:trimeric intracellular cation channel family protein [Opitutaceae bacterium]